VHDKNRPGEDGDLHERNQAREQAEGEQRAADEMGQGSSERESRFTKKSVRTLQISKRPRAKRPRPR
jgi:hypothetical protein